MNLAPPAPRPRAVLNKGEGEKWKIELKEFPAFRQALGEDVVNAFARCFVHTDRLQSLVSFVALSEKYHGKDSVAFERNLHTMVSFTAGTLRELALAIRDLRSALAKRGWLKPDSPPWLRLREVEGRWDDDPFYREMRNKLAYHVDTEVIERGLNELVADNTQVLLSRGEGRRADSSSLSLGFLAHVNGLGMTLEQYGKFAQAAGEDHGIGEPIQLAFIDALKAAGIPFGEE